MVCLETSFLVDLFRAHPPAIHAKETLEKSGEPITIASVTVVELLSNAFRNKKKKEQEYILSLIDEIETLPLDAPAAVRAAQIDADLAVRGESIDFEDVLIAATALQNGEAVLTANRQHFERIPGLAVRSY